MLRFKLILILLVFCFHSKVWSETASIQISSINCNDNAGIFAMGEYKTQTWDRDNGDFAQNFSDDQCGQEQIQNHLNGLKNSCPTYFDIVSVTPLQKGVASQFYDYKYNSWLDNSTYGYGFGGGFGYSYTHSIVFTYRCL